jgi:hypothetical protein
MLADFSTIKKQFNPEMGLQIYKTYAIYHKITKYILGLISTQVLCCDFFYVKN